MPSAQPTTPAAGDAPAAPWAVLGSLGLFWAIFRWLLPFLSHVGNTKFVFHTPSSSLYLCVGFSCVFLVCISSPQGPPGPQGPIGYPGPRGVKVRRCRSSVHVTGILQPGLDIAGGHRCPLRATSVTTCIYCSSEATRPMLCQIPAPELSHARPRHGHTGPCPNPMLCRWLDGGTEGCHSAGQEPGHC